jgi:putative nucleotidyltransferase with HDIG domain
MNRSTSRLSAESRSVTSQLSLAGTCYVLCVGLAGGVVLALSLPKLYADDVWARWLPLAALTLLSGSATVKLPAVPATISVSETFVFTSVLLFGPAAGAVIDALDGLIISLWLGKGRKQWYRVIFNMGAPAFSIWCAAHIYFAFPGVHPLIEGRIAIEELVVPLGAFALAHFLINSWLVSIAVSFQATRSAFEIWRHEMVWVSLNYFGGASVSALLAVYTRDVSPAFLGITVPLLLILYLTFKIPMARVEDSYRHVSEVNSLYLSTIETLAMAIDAKDQVTHGHIRRVQRYAVGLARALGINDAALLKAIEASALLHDMGKLAVPEHILNKPGKLSPAEFDKMKLHAAIGADILSAIEFPYPVVPIVRHHHENWNGTGYPDGLSGTAIPIGARILSVVDCYDALTSDRPYRPQLSHEAAVDILLTRRGTMYDPLVVDTFIRVHSAFSTQDADNVTPATHQRNSDNKLSQPASLTRRVATHNTTHPPMPARIGVRDDAVQTVCADLCRLTSASACIVATYDGGLDELVVRHSVGCGAVPLLGRRVPLGHRLLGWVGATRQAIANSDPALDFVEFEVSTPDNAVASLVIPICSGETLLGVVGLYGPRLFTEADQHTAEQIVRGLFTVGYVPHSAVS